MIQNRLSADRKTVRTQEDLYDITKHNASDDNEEALLLEELADVSDTHDSKLATIEENATADQTDEEIESAYNNRVAIGTQLEAETGTSTTVRRWNIAVIFAGWLNWIENKTTAALATTNKTLVGAINELKNAIDNLSSSPAVPEDYTTVAALFADQNAQTADSLYRIHDTSRDFRVQYLGTVVGDYTDYAGWPAYIFAQEGNNETLEFKVPEYNLKPKSVKVLCKNALTSQLSINPQVGGSNLLNSPIVVPVGGQHGISSDFNLSTIDAWDEISVAIANTNTVVEVVIDCIEISDAIPIPAIPLSQPTGLTATGSDGSVQLDYDAIDANADDVDVQRSTTSGSGFSTIATISRALITYTDNTVVNDTTYYYKLIANGSGSYSDSPASAEVEVTPSATQTQSDLILALSNLWTFVPGGNASNPLTDISGNGRDFTGAGGISFQQAAIETSGVNPYSFGTTVGVSGEAVRSQGFALNQDFEVGFAVRPSALATDKYIFALRNNGGGNSSIRFGLDATDNTAFRLRVTSPAGATSENVSSAGVWAANTTYWVTLTYVSSTGTFTARVNDSVVASLVVDMSAGTVDTIVWGNVNDGSNYGITGRYQELYMTVGGIPTSQQRTNIYSAGNYLV